MPIAITHEIITLLHTASVSTTVYGMDEAGRVFGSRGVGAPADRQWDFFGMSGGTVEIGHPIIVVMDDLVTLTSPVLDIEEPIRPIRVH